MHHMLPRMHRMYRWRLRGHVHYSLVNVIVRGVRVRPLCLCGAWDKGGDLRLSSLSGYGVGSEVPVGEMYDTRGSGVITTIAQ